MVEKKKEDALVVEGVVIEAQKNGFRVQMVGDGDTTALSGHIIQAHIAGKLRKNFIKIVPGDRVRVELSPYDLTRGRITYRLK